MRALVSGYYGFGNAGDEAVLAGLMSALRARGGAAADADVTVLSADPSETAAQHPVRAIGRMDVRAIRGALLKSDIFVLGGGSLLQDVTSLRSVLYYVFVTRLALRARVPVAFIAQGIGPLGRPLARALVRGVANRARVITVRDAGSADLLRDIGVRDVPVSVTADMVFALEPGPRELGRRALQAAGVPDGVPAVGVSVRPWRTSASLVEEPGEWVRALGRATGMHLVFAPMQRSVDLDMCRRAVAALPGGASVVCEPMCSRTWLSVLGQMTCVVGMRLHALIMAAVTAVPMVAISYDPKVDALMCGLGRPEFLVPLSEMSAARLSACASGCLEAREAFAGDLAGQLPALRTAAHSNVERILEAAGR